MLGLVTFWVYTTLRIARELRTHFARRWAELKARGDLKQTDPRLEALRVTGFTAAKAASWAAAAPSSAFFYAGTFVLTLSTVRTIRRHETLELLVREPAPAPSSRWATSATTWCAAGRSRPTTCCAAN